MYEMEGALRLARHTRSASLLAFPALRAARQCQAPARITSFPVLPASRGCPRMVPVSNGESISTRLPERRARVYGNSCGVFSRSTRCPQNADSYPHVAAVVHRLMHSSSTGSGDKPPESGPALRYVIVKYFNDHFPLITESLPHRLPACLASAGSPRPLPLAACSPTPASLVLRVVVSPRGVAAGSATGWLADASMPASAHRKCNCPVSSVGLPWTHDDKAAGQTRRAALVTSGCPDVQRGYRVSVVQAQAGNRPRESLGAVFIYPRLVRFPAPPLLLTRP
jgi:hypothetical protein